MAEMPDRQRLQRSLLFEDVPADLVETLLTESTTEALDPGDLLLAADAENATLYLVVSGALSVRFANGIRPHLRLGPGDCAGELSVIDESRVSADVVAVEKTTVVGLSRERVLQFIDQSPQAARN